MREDATPSLSPIAAQTPKAFHSIKFLISVMRLCIGDIKVMIYSNIKQARKLSFQYFNIKESWVYP